MEEILRKLAEKSQMILDCQDRLKAEIAEQKGATETLIGALKSESLDQIKSLREQYTALQKDVEAFMAKANRPGVGGTDQSPRGIGARFAQHVKSQRELKGAQFDPRRMDPFRVEETITKAIVVSTGQSPIVDAQRLPGIQFQPRRPLRLRQLIPVMPTSSNAIEFVQETRFNQLAAEITSSAASGQKDVAVNNINGFFVGQSITLSPGTAKEEAHVIASLTSPTQASAAGTITTTVNLANTHAAWTGASPYSEGLVVSDRFVCTPDIQIKPAAETKLEVVSNGVKTIAHTITITRQLFEDEAALGPHLDLQLTAGLAEEEESQILYGDGSSTQLAGIFSNASVQTYAWSDGQVGDTRYDAIRRAITFAAIANHTPDAVVIHPTTWEAIQTQKGTDGHYVNLMLMQGGQPMAWGLPVVDTTAINSDDGLVGSFGMACSIFERTGAEVMVAEQHSDYFVRNLLMIRAEQRETFCIYRPESFVAIDFDEAPTPA